jgi:hypothetical protein
MGCDVSAILIVPIESQHLLSSKGPRPSERGGESVLIHMCFLLVCRLSSVVLALNLVSGNIP